MGAGQQMPRAGPVEQDAADSGPSFFVSVMCPCAELGAQSILHDVSLVKHRCELMEDDAPCWE